MKLYLDEDIDPLLAQILRDRGIDCLTTGEAGNRALPDVQQLVFATGQRRTILTFNVRDFVRLAQEYAASGRSHSGIIVSDHLPFRVLLRRTLRLIQNKASQDLTDTLIWLQDYKHEDNP